MTAATTTVSSASSSKIAHAYIWTALGSGVKHFFGFGISMLLARLLTPADYGLIGIVLVFTSFLSVIQESGLAQAIVFFKDDEQSYLSTHQTVNLAAGLLLAAILFVVSPAIAAFYGVPALTAITQVMGFSFVLNGLRSVSQNVMAKHFRFREIAIIETVAAFSSAGIAIAMAAAGFGVWSLVANMLLASTIQTVLILSRQPPKWTLHPDRDCIRRILRWGLPMTGNSMAWRLYDSADMLIIGKLLGQQPLGVYSMAIRLATLVNEKIGSIVGRVSFVSFASMQDAKEHAVQHWHTLTETLTLITFPILTAVAVNAEDIVLVVLGRKWAEAIVPLQILCIVGAMKSITPMTNNLMSGLGRPDIPFRFTLMNLFVLPLSFFIGARLNGIEGVSWAWVIGFPPMAAWLIHKAVRVTGSSAQAYLRALLFPVLTSLVCMAAMWAAGAMLPQGFLRLSVRGTVGVVSYLSCLYLHPRSRGRLAGAVAKVRARFA